MIPLLNNQKNPPDEIEFTYHLHLDAFNLYYVLCLLFGHPQDLGLIKFVVRNATLLWFR